MNATDVGKFYVLCADDIFTFASGRCGEVTGKLSSDIILIDC
jgi:hypothetical protein